MVGKDVPFALLRGHRRMTTMTLRAGLAQLQAAEFLYETRLFPELEYTFKHALTHEVAYAALAGAAAARCTRAIVEAIERLYPDRVAEQVERLAHHADARRVARQGRAVPARGRGQGGGAFRQSRGGRVLRASATDPRRLPETPERLSEAVDMRIALGPALIGLKSASTPEVVSSYDHAKSPRPPGRHGPPLPGALGTLVCRLHGRGLRGGARHR